MKLKKFLAFSFLILLVFSMTAIATAQPIVDDIVLCPATGGGCSLYYHNTYFVYIGNVYTQVEVWICSNCEGELYIY